jgi:hypothetical protein
MLGQGVLERVETAHYDSHYVAMSEQPKAVMCFNVNACVALASLPLSVLLLGHGCLQKSRTSLMVKYARQRQYRKTMMIERMGLSDFNIY